MCGIVGYIGSGDAVQTLLDGLRRLEYRGYDSAGLVLQSGSRLEIRRSVGKIDRLCEVVGRLPVSGTTGLGHTRWATHGRPSDRNAHPHTDCSGRLAIVHNGIVENYLHLKGELEAEGHGFVSETDTEVVAHLVEREIAEGHDLAEAVRRIVATIGGAYALCVLSADDPGRIVAAKRGGGAVVIGQGEGEVFVASDIPAVLPHTRSVMILEDGEIADIRQERVDVSTLTGAPVVRAASVITWNAAMAEKAGYPHFMLKEIHEQPEAVASTIRAHVDIEAGTVLLPESGIDAEIANEIERVIFVSCGTSYHAALLGRTMIERLAGVAAEVDLASEFRYRDAVVGAKTLLVAISQSGETADTLGAAKIARERGARVVAITNAVGSALAREADGVLYTKAGPEIGVASTKTFTATAALCYLLGVKLGLQRGYLTSIEGQKRLGELAELPALMSRALECQNAITGLARELLAFQNILYMGRGLHHAIALEGALKLKEVSYRHAEGYAAGEMKHGPIALIDDGMPVVVLTPRDSTYERMVGNVEEIKARGGRLVAICHQGDQEMARRAYRTIEVPAVVDLLAPLVSVIPLQLLAYYVAVLSGCDVDQPRNLAKSVTVE
jgi:glutamine---fructose-6-phosphate transaminase (isomerizing)